MTCQSCDIAWRDHHVHKSKSASSEVVCMNWFKSYCMPLVLYALEALEPSNSVLRMLDKLICTAVGKIFGTYNCEILSDIRLNFNLNTVKSMVDSKKCKFKKSFLKKAFYFAKTIDCLNSSVYDT